MNKELLARATILINVPISRVWKALTDPELIQQYLFGTEVTTDWQVGSPIIYKGMWEGKPFEDKGKVLQIEPKRLLVSSFWSALSGLPDVPENYQTVRYELSAEGSGTRVTLTQDNNHSQEEANRASGNWEMVLDGMKKLLEE